MNIVGKWKVSEMMFFGDEEFTFAPIEKHLEAAEDDDAREEVKQLFGTVSEYNADGSVVSLMPIPDGVSAEDIEAAKAEGEVFTEDNKYLVVEKKDAHEGWKEENGELFIHSGVSGTVMDEEYNPWEKVTVIDDDNFEYLMLRYTRA